MPRTKKRRGDEITITGMEFPVDDIQDEHHTDEIESDKHLVVRRGGKMQFEVTFSRPLSGDDFEVEFHRGYRTSFRRGTRFVAELGQKRKHDHQLPIREVESDGPKVTFEITLPATLPVGEYRMVAEVSPARSRARSSWEVDRQLVILFNPWCKDDGVFVPEESNRQEYVLNESGLIWAGTHDDMFTWPWNFAQFDTSTLEAVLHLLELYSKIDSEGRQDPIKVTRALIEMVNSSDFDGGILEGLWSANDDDYKDGTSPTAWSGSSAILEEFLETKRTVKYAQCWVFAGTLTSVLRAVGIPARPVTNFDSAHDADSNRAIDYYYDMDDQMVEEKSGDSIWNYHVWVEAWMSRPDLGPSYGGWQAVDATPQELSPHSQTFVVGPASVTAIKDGQDLPYDNEFVIAEVNADVKYYSEVKRGKFEHSGSNTSHVGKKISTKAVGSRRREDVTGNYKYREGTVAERAAHGAKGDNAKVEDVEFEVTFSKRASIGESFDVQVSLQTRAKGNRTVRVRTNVHAVSYTGGDRKDVKKSTQKVVLSGGSGQAVVRVSADDYLDVLGDQALLSVTVLALVEETEQSWVGKQPYRLRRPDLDVSIDGQAVTDEPMELSGNQTYEVDVSFTNPLQKPLTDVVLYIEGAKLKAPKKIKGQSTPPGDVAKMSFEITPKKPRRRAQERTLIVTCQSKELKGIMGTATLMIKR